MAEIDSIEVGIKVQATQANKELDKMAGKLGKVSDAMEKVSNNSGLKKAAESAGKITGIVSKISERSVNIKPIIDTKNLEREQKKYESQLRNWQNRLSEIMATSSADKQVKGIERATVKINEAKNALAEIKRLISSETSNMPDFSPELEKKFKISEESQSLVSLKKSLKEYEDFMSQYTPTEIFNENFKSDLENLKNSFPEAEDVIAKYENLYKKSLEIAKNKPDSKSVDKPVIELREEISALDSAIKNVPPIEFEGNFYEMEKWIDELNQKLLSLLNKRERLVDLGANPKSQRIAGMSYDIEQISKTLDKYEEKLKKARESGKLEIKVPDISDGIEKKAKTAVEKIQSVFKKFKIVVPNENLKEVEKQIDKIKKKYEEMVKTIGTKSATNKFYGASEDFKKKQIELAGMRSEYQKLIEKQKQLSVSGGYNLNFDGAKKSLKDFNKSFQPLYTGLKKLDKWIAGIGKKMLSIVAPTKKAKEALNGMSITNAGLAKSLLRTTKMLKLMIVRMALRGIIDGVKTGMQNLAIYSDKVNASLSLLMNSLNQLKNSFAAAVAPVLNTFAPALNKIIQLCIKTVNAINQVLSALTGGSTWIRAKELNDSYRDSLDKTGKSAKSLNKQLQGFDKLNNLTTSQSGSASGTSAKNMFETLPIEDKWKKLAATIKDIAKQIFNPLKKAWDRQGKFVMQSWEKALKSVWSLVKSIGKDFLAVWQQEKTVKIFENILRIIGNIGNVVSNLAINFKKAWESNDTGRKIFENIRDIIGAIVENLKHASESTVNWSKNLNFEPVLKKFEEWTKSLVPLFDTLSGIITDFYEQVLLPLGKWNVEKGLPQLLQVFIDFNKKVKWNKLRNQFSELWKHLEPFAEKVGEGLVIFIGKLSDVLVNFVNSPAFENFLKKIEDWMDKVSPDDVANGIEKIIKVIIGLKIALAGLKAVGSGLQILSTLANVMTLFGGSSVAKGVEVAGETVAKTGVFAQLGSKISTLIGGAITSAGGMQAIIAAGTLIAETLFAAIVAAIAGWNLGQWINEKLTGEEIDMSFSEQMTEIKESFSDGSWKDALKLWGEDIYDGFLAVSESEDELMKPVKDGLNEVRGMFSDGQFGEAMSLWGQDIYDGFLSVSQSQDNFMKPFKDKYNEVKGLFTDGQFGAAMGEWGNDIKLKLNSVKDNFLLTWDNIKLGVKSAWQATVDGLKEIWNKFATWLNEKLSFDIPPINIAGKELFGGTHIDLGKIPTFASGGYVPKQYSLLMAGENGVPEIAGTVGGKTAVAGGAEITGIKDAILQASNSEMALMRQQNTLLQGILAKEFGISQSDVGKAARSYAKDYNQRTGKDAYSFA